MIYEHEIDRVTACGRVLRDLTIEDVSWGVSYEVECGDPEKHFDNPETIAQIRKKADWNPWVWCTVKVTGHYKCLYEFEYLGACSYESVEDFKAGGYYEDMQLAILDKLNMSVKAIVEGLVV